MSPRAHDPEPPRDHRPARLARRALPEHPAPSGHPTELERSARSAPFVRIDELNAGRRLDVFLRQLLHDTALGALMRWIRTGAVRVNDRRVKGAMRLAAGDVVTLPEPPPGRPEGAERPERTGRPGQIQATDRSTRPRSSAGFVLLFEDEDLLVVAKPAGLATQPGSGHETDSLLTRVLDYLGAEHAPPGRRPGLVQRLDRDVSGLLIVGKHRPVLRTLTEAAAHGALDKVYLALVHGTLAVARGTIDLPLRIAPRAAGDAPRTRPDPGGLEAVTDYTVAERLAGATLLEVRLRTGRMHQIRAHLRAIGHPIVGDPRYGAGSLPLAGVRLTRPFLHAARLSLLHPRTGERLSFAAPLPVELEAALRRARSTGPRSRR